MDRELEPQQSTTAPAPTAAPATESGGGAQQYTSDGTIPPVANAAPAAAAPPPSASDQAFGGNGGGGHGFFGKIGDGFKKVGQEIEVGAAEGVGVAELAGLRYPVKPYEAQVDGGLYRGSRLDDDGMAALKQMGIKGVVNLCLENNDDAPRAAKLGLAALHVPILDNSAPSIGQMNQFISFAKANPPTYVHCEAGKGRTGTAVACYRIAVDGWTADQAIKEGEGFGLSLINQIAFVRTFAETQGQGAAVPEAAPAAAAPVQASADPPAK